jgi:hypothetical protein
MHGDGGGASSASSSAGLGASAQQSASAADLPATAPLVRRFFATCPGGLEAAAEEEVAARYGARARARRLKLGRLELELLEPVRALAMITAWIA